jgi:hypothetical protein
MRFEACAAFVVKNIDHTVVENTGSDIHPEKTWERVGSVAQQQN